MGWMIGVVEYRYPVRISEVRMLKVNELNVRACLMKEELNCTDHVVFSVVGARASVPSTSRKRHRCEFFARRFYHDDKLCVGERAAGMQGGSSRSSAAFVRARCSCSAGSADAQVSHPIPKRGKTPRKDSSHTVLRIKPTMVRCISRRLLVRKLAVRGVSDRPSARKGIALRITVGFPGIWVTHVQFVMDESVIDHVSQHGVTDRDIGVRD